MNCNNCGANHDCKFCPECGTPAPLAQQPTAAPASAAPVFPPVMQPAAEPVAGNNPQPAPPAPMGQLTCYVHPNHAATCACVHCGKFICGECTTEIGGKSYCKQCVNEVFHQQKNELEKAQNYVAHQPAVPPVVINNTSASNSANTNANTNHVSNIHMNTRVGRYPRQSCLIHVLLLLFTGGIGNIIYAIYVAHQQSKWR